MNQLTFRKFDHFLGGETIQSISQIKRNSQILCIFLLAYHLEFFTFIYVSRFYFLFYSDCYIYSYNVRKIILIFVYVCAMNQ